MKRVQEQQSWWYGQGTHREPQEAVAKERRRPFEKTKAYCIHLSLMLEPVYRQDIVLVTTARLPTLHSRMRALFGTLAFTGCFGKEFEVKHSLGGGMI